jgi:hypothetical protein
MSRSRVLSALLAIRSAAICACCSLGGVDQHDVQAVVLDAFDLAALVGEGQQRLDFGDCFCDETEIRHSVFLRCCGVSALPQSFKSVRLTMKPSTRIAFMILPSYWHAAAASSVAALADGGARMAGTHQSLERIHLPSLFGQLSFLPSDFLLLLLDLRLLELD